MLDAKRDQMAGKGVLYARSPGARNHTRLFMAVTDPDAIDTLRFNRGFITAEKQALLRDDVARGLRQEVERVQPHTLILSAHQLGCTLVTRSELERLRALLAPLSEDIHILAHLDDPARMLVRHYAAQLMEGRAASLALELDLLDSPFFRDAALATRRAADPQCGRFPEVQGAAYWLDFRRLQEDWEAVFGAGAVAFRSIDRACLQGADATEELRAAFGIEAQIGKADPVAVRTEPSAAWLTRARLFNDAVLRLLAARQIVLPRQLWRRFLGEMRVEGAPIAPGSLASLSRHFERDIAALCAAHPGLDADRMAPDPPLPDWTEADPTRGFRATQYLMAFRWRIEQAGRQALEEKAVDLARIEPEPPAVVVEAVSAAPIKVSADLDALLSPSAQKVMPPMARQNFAKLRRSVFAPHNRLGAVDEETLSDAFTPAPPRTLPDGSTGNVIVGCMKNEAPYILEWVAYHRAIGVDNFLIYTNGCEDGTTEILDRLQALGMLQHRNNDELERQFSPAIRARRRAVRAGDRRRGLDHPYRRGRIHQRALRQRHPAGFLRPSAGRHQRGDDLAAVRPQRGDAARGSLRDRSVRHLRAEILPQAAHGLGLQDDVPQYRRLRQTVLPPAQQAGASA